MRTALAFILLFFQFSLLAQQRLSFKTNPLHLLEIEKYVVPFGLEYSIGKFSISAEQMVMVSKKSEFSRENREYFKSNLQLRYYLNDMFTGVTLGFVGLHGTMRKYDFIEFDDHYISGEGRNIRYVDSLVETQNFGAYAISGIQIQSRSHIIFEFVMGFGVREVSIKHNPGEIEFVEFLDPFLFENFDPEWREGTRTIPGVLLQMRFGYTLIGKKKG